MSNTEDIPKNYDQDTEVYESPNSDDGEPGGLVRVGGFIAETAGEAAPTKIQIDSRPEHNPGDDWDGTHAFGKPRRLPGARGARRLANLQRHQDTMRRL